MFIEILFLTKYKSSMSLQTRVISHHLSSSQPDTAQALSFEMIPLSLIPWSANLFVMIINLRKNINRYLYTFLLKNKRLQKKWFYASTKLFKFNCLRRMVCKSKLT